MRREKTSAVTSPSLRAVSPEIVNVVEADTLPVVSSTSSVSTRRAKSAPVVRTDSLLERRRFELPVRFRILQLPLKADRRFESLAASV
jgi:hypothetical protein